MKNLHLNVFARYWIVLCALLLAGVSTQVNAQTEKPGQHPAYLHAIRSLRQARYYLDKKYTEPGHEQKAEQAIHEIDQAIDALKKASKDDDKDLANVPNYKDVPDTTRFAKAVDLLNGAHRYTDMPEVDPAAMPYREAALHHIDAAKATIQQNL
jgi:hypothetical protein